MENSVAEENIQGKKSLNREIRFGKERKNTTSAAVLGIWNLSPLTLHLS